MQWNDHSKLKGTHALLSPSQPAWLKYDEVRLLEKYDTSMAAAKGTALHEIAEDLIRNRIKLNKNDKHLIQFELLKKGIPGDVINPDECLATLLPYVNDAINYCLTPEVILYYSEFCYGTTDAIGFRNMRLRIQDLKSGETPAKIEQLMIYAGLFCLEYDIDPTKIQTSLGIYQKGEVLEDEPSAMDIRDVMDNIVISSKVLIKEKR